MDSLKFPVGEFKRTSNPTPVHRSAWIRDLEELPRRLRDAVTGLDDRQLDTPYRPGGWTVRQVVHHLADSHVNGWVRLSLALAEEGRTAQTYDQARWAEQPFARSGPIEPSLTLLEGLHARWAATAGGLEEEALRRTLEHPDWGEVTVDDLLALYAWHSRHHTRHILALREREGWIA